MKDKHLKAYVKICLVLAELSECPRRKFGALLIEPERNLILGTGYNGGPRGAPGKLCGGDVCDRDEQKIPSGTRMELGCHHSETNVVANAASNGIATKGTWLIVTGEPCAMCARLLHHAGIVRVICVRGGYAGGGDGVAYLAKHGVEVAYVDGPQDPRSALPVDPLGGMSEKEWAWQRRMRAGLDDGIPSDALCQRGCGHGDCDGECCRRGVKLTFSKDFDSTQSRDCGWLAHRCEKHSSSWSCACVHAPEQHGSVGCAAQDMWGTKCPCASAYVG